MTERQKENEAQRLREELSKIDKSKFVRDKPFTPPKSFWRWG